MFETGYYRILKDNKDSYYVKKGFRAGAMVYAIAEEDGMRVLFEDSTWTYKYDEEEDMQNFQDFFEFEPNGAEIRQQEIADLMREIQETNLLTTQIQNQLSNFNPCVTESGDLSETGTSLSPVSDMRSIKLAVANTRNTLAKTKKSIESKTNQLSRLLGEQSKILAMKTKELEELLSKAEEAMWSINLYLGKNEEVHILRKGFPAPEDQKIVLRQQVLYMDEECAIAARTEGIDIHSIEQFDKWLLESPAHLNQVLYETKAIVALHVKRKPKNYGERYMNQTINEANLTWTYFLIRNGENLYRVFIDVDAGSYMFPTTDSLTNLFSNYRPGSKEYMDSIKRAEESHRHYLRILLVIQGLLDRTPIFKPMPLSRINICDPGQCYEFVEFVYDAERQLTDGKPVFDEWLENVNSQIEVGHRIMGIFDSRSLPVDGGEYIDSRILPKNACRPDNKTLYAIDHQKDGRFVFYFERTQDRVYSRYGRSHTPKTRASCWVDQGDNFILDFDSVDLKDLEYYSTHRQSRHLYRDMIPLLEESIRLKKKEKEDEEPFRKLLIGQIMVTHKVSHEEAESSVDELIQWWKFKNRTHRALLSDDTLALSMIVSEFDIRRRNLSSQGESQAVVNAIKAYFDSQNVEPLMVAQKKDNVYVAYIPQNQDNIWVTEQEWKFNRSTGMVTMMEESPWQTVDKRHWRWEVVYTSDRWKGWRVNPIKSKVLTDSEIEEVIEKGLKTIENAYDKRERFLPLALFCSDDFKITIWFSDQGAKIPQFLWSGGIEGPSIRSQEINWVKKKGELTVGRYSYSSRYLSSASPWDKGETFKRWDENIKIVEEEQRAEEEAKGKKKEIQYRYSYVERIISENDYNKKVSQAKWEFFEEHGDPELWEDHLECLKINKMSYGVVDAALRLWAERGLDPVGKSLGEALEAARGWGLFDRKSRNSWDPDYKIPEDIDLAWVIPPVPQKEEE